jgi:hypothetical protein
MDITSLSVIVISQATVTTADNLHSLKTQVSTLNMCSVGSSGLPPILPCFARLAGIAQLMEIFDFQVVRELLLQALDLRQGQLHALLIFDVVKYRGLPMTFVLLSPSDTTIEIEFRSAYHKGQR